MLIAIAALSVALAAPASVPPQTIQDWESLQAADPRTAEVYLFGVGEAYGWTNVTLESRGDKALFCTPRKLQLLSINYIQIANDEITRRREAHQLPANYTVELALLNGLQRVFPCQ